MKNKKPRNEQDKGKDILVELNEQKNKNWKQPNNGETHDK